MRSLKLKSENHVRAALVASREQGLIDEADTSVIFIDMDIIDDRVSRLKAEFPSSTLHAVAIKSNPLASVLKFLVQLDTGLEAASLSEVKMAVDAGASLNRIVFDSPAKTRQEIEYLQKYYPGIRINADSLDELKRYPTRDSKLRLGLRVNPNVSSKTIDSMNVSGAYTKFGQLMSGSNDPIIDSCLRWQDLDCLHFHIGSQHESFEPVFAAANRVVDLAETINQAAGYSKIKTIDIGGGFPVNYSAGPPFEIEEYAIGLRDHCPRLFDGTYNLITEFGRYVHAHAGWVATRIEYVKETLSGKQIAIVHVGADMFLRECYNPDDWHHNHFVLNPDFSAKAISAKSENDAGAGVASTDFAGPLCFGGDFVIRQSKLAEVAEEDWLVVLDVGANTFALWSRHCSRPFPKVIQIRGREFAIAKPRESYESIAQFWN